LVGDFFGAQFGFAFLHNFGEKRLSGLESGCIQLKQLIGGCSGIVRNCADCAELCFFVRDCALGISFFCGGIGFWQRPCNSEKHDSGTDAG